MPFSRYTQSMMRHIVKWMAEYEGRRFLFEDYVILSDGKYHDVYMYWFNTRGAKNDNIK